MKLDEKSYLERIADALEVINDGASTRTIDITENGIIDVKNFAYANVNVEDSGGTEITNPKLTINVNASGVVGEIGSIPLIQFNDGTLQNIHSTVNGGSTYTFECYVLEDAYEDEESEYVWDCPPINSVLGTDKTLSVSNEVNVTVTLDQGDGIFYAIITDPAEPASFTLTVS